MHCRPISAEPPGGSDRHYELGSSDRPVLEVRDLTVSFPTARGELVAVEKMSFQVARGEVLALVGESGAGKSVSALAVMGLLPPRSRVSGSVRLSGRELMGLADRELSSERGRTISMVLQNPLSCLSPLYRVGDQIAETLLAHQDLDRAQAARQAVELLDLVGVIEPVERARQLPHELSGGLRQRVMIATAIANRPKVIIADEPTSALDVLVQAQVLEVLRVARQATGSALILITHDLGVVAGTADRVMVMDGGRLVHTGNVGTILPPPRPPSVFPRGTKASRSHPAMALPGRAHTPSARPSGPRAVVLRVRDLMKYYPLDAGTLGRRRAVTTFKAIDGVSFDVCHGEALALVGESGAGKTTMLREIVALRPPMAGSITFLGRSVVNLGRKQRRKLRADLGLVFQDPGASLDPRMAVWDLVAEGLRVAGVGREQRRERARNLVLTVGLGAEHLDRYASELSGGQCQRVAIARALALEPRLLLLDEPVSALDASVRTGLIDLLAELKATRGLAYLLVTHDLNAVRSLADRVAVMRGGRIVEIGATDVVFARAAHPYTRELLAVTPGPDLMSLQERPTSLPLGGPLSPAGPDTGCRFRERCPRFAAIDTLSARRCVEEAPVLVGLEGGHASECHYPHINYPHMNEEREERVPRPQVLHSAGSGSP